MPTPTYLSALMVALALAACTTETGLQRGTAHACAACSSDLDCAEGLLCDQDAFACKSVAQLKAKKTTPGQPQCDADCWDSCAIGGACHVVSAADASHVGQRCGPTSDADCQASKYCAGGKNCKYSPNVDGFPACVN